MSALFALLDRWAAIEPDRCRLAALPRGSHQVRYAGHWRAACEQPFGDTAVSMALKGAIEDALAEQGWQAARGTRAGEIVLFNESDYSRVAGSTGPADVALLTAYLDALVARPVCTAVAV